MEAKPVDPEPVKRKCSDELILENFFGEKINQVAVIEANKGSKRNSVFSRIGGVATLDYSKKTKVSVGESILKLIKKPENVKDDENLVIGADKSDGDSDDDLDFLQKPSSEKEINLDGKSYDSDVVSSENDSL